MTLDYTDTFAVASEQMCSMKYSVGLTRVG